jgi:hypothetical protein
MEPGSRLSVGVSVVLVKARNASAILHGIVTIAATGCSISAALFKKQIVSRWASVGSVHYSMCNLYSVIFYSYLWFS